MVLVTLQLLVDASAAGTAHPLRAGGRVAAPVRLFAAWAGRAALQAAPLRNLFLRAQASRLLWAPLQHAVGRQLAGVLLCVLAAGVAEQQAASEVLFPMA